MDLDFFNKATENEKLMKDTEDAMSKADKKEAKALLAEENETIEKAVAKKSETARKKMLDTMDDRDESTIGLSDDYWAHKKEYHQALHEEKD